MDVSKILTIKKSQILNDQEKICFDILNHSIESSMCILPKMQVKDLFEAAPEHSDDSFWSNFKKISQKHFDFLICDRKHFKPLLVIRMRGVAHHEHIEEHEEELLKKILEHAHIPLLDISFAEIDQYKKDFEQYVMNVRIKEALELE